MRMKITYEMNPPRIMTSNSHSNCNYPNTSQIERFDLQSLNSDLARFYSRVRALSGLAYMIHVTDSVLGIPRLSSISIGREIVHKHKLRTRCSIRVRDRNTNAILQLVTDAILAGIDGLLVIKGDEPKHSSIDSALKPSSVVRFMNEHGFSKHIRLYLSIDAENYSEDELNRKISAEPHGLITQSISSLEPLVLLADKVKANNMCIVPCIMVPSPKNRASAESINLDWSRYEHDLESFVLEAYRLCGEVMITSPNSFNDGIDTLKRLMYGKVYKKGTMQRGSNTVGVEYKGEEGKNGMIR
ncbi:MAG: methylenetetrahydrofolate reductase [Candidatus Nitrosocaldus sp.]